MLNNFERAMLDSFQYSNMQTFRENHHLVEEIYGSDDIKAQ